MINMAMRKLIVSEKISLQMKTLEFLVARTLTRQNDAAKWCGKKEAGHLDDDDKNKAVANQNKSDSQNNVRKNDDEDDGTQNPDDGNNAAENNEGKSGDGNTNAEHNDSVHDDNKNNNARNKNGEITLKDVMVRRYRWSKSRCSN